jgi:hypothetical protein
LPVELLVELRVDLRVKEPRGSVKRKAPLKQRRFLSG